jgi:hypothetical protein
LKTAVGNVRLVQMAMPGVSAWECSVHFQAVGRSFLRLRHWVLVKANVTLKDYLFGQIRMFRSPEKRRNT